MGAAIRTAMIFISGTVLLLTVWFAPHAAQAGDSDIEDGMIGWPGAEMSEALDYFIARRMKELDVPGVAVAIIANGKVVLEKGYGTADAKGHQPVTANTLFEAGALGLPIEAYGALLLVSEGKLLLDAPLSDNLKEPWLRDEEAGHEITLRNVLNHTSGLSDWVRLGSRSMSFEPGDRFAYSRIGYVYLAHVMAETAGMSFDRLMKERVFRPLGMSSSGYILPDGLVDEVARGHHALWVPVATIAGPAIAIFIVFGLVTFLIVRFGFHRLKLEPLDLLPAAGVALVATCLWLYLVQGGWALLFCLGYFMAWLGGAAAVVAMIQYLRLIFEQGRNDGVLLSRRGGRRWPVSPAVLVLVFLTSLFFMPRQVPSPVRDGGDFNAALSFRSSAHDLGLFVTGFSNAALLGPQWRARMMRERIDAGGAPGDRFSWGLGFGVRERRNHLTLWQESSNIGSRGLMVIDPARRAGVVVLTNADSGRILIQEIAGHVLGPEDRWRLP
ncbi:MAG: hypothetical protein CVT73_00880 [Alphaproteobacteria bacterium HGW-Alphaproteobacteria-12]|nr:MAG: hypothetical protein CVT73_00880 [Alphaproteobacteria bacterium HGW-Alphaproteobacteria-12]